MPAKYHIHTESVPPRFRPVGKLGIVDWREDCAGCHNCVKRACVYGFYRDEADTLRDEVGYLDYVYQCKGCLNCVQNCTKGILSRVVNPEYKRLGDDYFTPEIVLSTWFQAEAGGIPVSGAGYGGPFSGPGFDSIWTDMSEIVRPTRDGIHGREYISTSVDIGRKLPHLLLRDGVPAVPPALVESPVPLVFDIIPDNFQRGPVLAAVTQAAAKMGMFAVVRARDLPAPPRVDPNVPHGSAAGKKDAAAPEIARGCAIPFLADVNNPLSPSKVGGAVAADAVERGSGEGWPTYTHAPIVMISDGPAVMQLHASLKKENPARLVSVRLAATPQSAARVLELTRAGVEVIHLVFDSHGREAAPSKPRHARDVLREVHGALVKAGIRDELTLVASGGIVLPEHMAKAIICGADLVAIDLPLLVALECRLCGACLRGEECPIQLEEIAPRAAAQRICNLIGAWRNQLLEMLGAMGIREVRRLRGETGRCTFFEDLERNTFGRLFGKRKEQDGAL